MSTKTIPPQTIVTCDCCQRTNTDAAFKKAATLVFSQAALDMYNCAAADATVRLDLCDDCAGSIGEAINKECLLIRKQVGVQP